MAQVTLFSAPNYCGEFDNAGAMMTLDEKLGYTEQRDPFWVGRVGMMTDMCPPFLMLLPDAESL